MKKVLLYSIMTEHMLNILNGNKTIEVRKRDLPQWAKESLERGEVVEGYGYCTKGKPYLYDFRYTSMMEQKYEIANVLIDSMQQFVTNGFVVVKFEVNGTTFLNCGSEAFNSITEKSCLTLDDLINYCGGKDLYAHHFTNIQPIEPMEIGEFYKHDYTYVEQKELPCERVMKQDGYLLATYDIAGLRWVIEPNKFTKAPQSFMTVWVKEEMK